MKIRTLNKIADKNHIQKSVAFLYTDSNFSERENNLIYNSIRRNNSPGNKFNQRGERPVHWKQDIDKIN